jgi:hypothetical protein
VVADVVSDETAGLYKELLDDVVIVRLVVGYAEAVRRARTRPIFLTWDEFRELHAQEAGMRVADHRVETGGRSVGEVAAAVGGLWIT